MAILTGKPSSQAKGATSSAITLDRATLISQMSIVDAFWADSSNWSQVIFSYEDATGKQRRDMLFGVSNSSNFVTSVHALANGWVVKRITIDDFDGGQYCIPRADFTSASEFDITVT